MLLQEFFSIDSGGHIPEIEGMLYLKSEGKKAWKRFYFVLRASGIYYNPKGKSKVTTNNVSQCVEDGDVRLVLNYSVVCTSAPTKLWFKQLNCASVIRLLRTS